MCILGSLQLFVIVLSYLLLTCLERFFGVSGTILNWCKSYFTDHRQFVSMGGYRSEISLVLTGVPQGSVLGPLLAFASYAPIL